jgi:AraC-like DNA-binding protein
VRSDDDRPSSSAARASKSPARPEPPQHADLAAALPPADTLSTVLDAVRLRGALFFVVDAGSSWVAEAPAGDVLAPVIMPGCEHVISYHLVTAGACYCSLPGLPSTRVDAGDVIVVPHGTPYALSSTPRELVPSPPESLLPFFSQMARGELPRVLVEGDRSTTGERIHVACGFLGCDARPFNPLIAALPPLIHLQPAQCGPEATRRLAALIDFAQAESRAPRAGSDCVLLRLSELLFVELVRGYVATLPERETGWLAGLRDPIVARALALLHGRPAHAWTLEQLADRVAASRSTLAARFAGFVGQPPMQYLTRWRMQLATRLLTDTSSKVAAVALAVGYDSEAAFSRAFKKAAGASPSAFRARAAAR